jgi:hypothetical protein
VGRIILQHLIMSRSSLTQLQQFISGNKIGRTNGVLLFDAEIQFLTGGNCHTIHSAVQVIMLPEASVLYILEFFKQGYGQNEMYSTADYAFTCEDAKTLRVTNDAAAISITISLHKAV